MTLRENCGGIGRDTFFLPRRNTQPPSAVATAAAAVPVRRAGRRFLDSPRATSPDAPNASAARGFM